MTLEVLEEEINNMNNGITRTHSPTFLTEVDFLRKITTSLSILKNQECKNQEVDKDMGEGLKKPEGQRQFKELE